MKRKKIKFSPRESCSAILDRREKITGKNLDSIINIAVIYEFEPRIPELKAEFDYDVQRYDGLIEGVNINLSDDIIFPDERISQYELRQGIGRALCYARDHDPISDISFLLPILEKFDFAQEDYMEQKYTKEVLQSFRDAYVLMTKKTKFLFSPWNVAQNIILGWKKYGFNNELICYKALINMIYFGKLRARLSLTDSLNCLSSIDNQIVDNLIASQKEKKRNFTENQTSHG